MKKYGFFVILGGLLIVTYRESIAWLWKAWMDNADYSHGPLIPLVSLFLIWNKRDVIRGLPKRSNTYGLVICIAAMLLQIVSVRADVAFTSCYSLILFCIGTVLFLYGKETSKVLLFPLSYLVFMVPFFQFLIKPLSNKLKVLSAMLSSNIAGFLGVPVFREGVMLNLTAGSMEVANPCSGIRSLFALLALGALFAYFSRGTSYRKFLLFLSAIPLAVAGNTLRLLALIVIAEKTGTIVSAGFWHYFIGFLVFPFALIGLVVVQRILKC